MKNDIRKMMLERRQSLSHDDKKRFDAKILKCIRDDNKYQQAKTVALFYPMPSEIDVLDLLKDNKVFLFPKVVGNDIEFYPYHANMRFIKSAFGVKEPAEGHPYHMTIDYMIVPALAIDKEGYRIGYGKGFYDKYLNKRRPKTTIGVIYPFQFIDYIDRDKYDQKLDGYVKG